MNKAPLLSRRLPFLPLTATAVAGIVLASCLPLSSVPWLALGVMAFAAFLFASRHTATFIVFVAASFASLTLWQNRESPAAEISRWLGTQPSIVETIGTVSDSPRSFKNGEEAFDFHASKFVIDGKAFPLTLPLAVEAVGGPFHYGDHLRLIGPMANLPPPRNPGQFPLAKWSALRGIHSHIEASAPPDAEILNHDSGNSFMTLALRLRDKMRETLSLGIDDPVVSDLIVAMTLGETSSLPESIQKQFRGTGTFHLFSVSGLHVGIVAVVMWYALRAFGVPRQIAVFIVVPVLFFYAVMTGWKPACVRAALMASIVLLAFLAKRPPQLFNNLCAAAFIILLLSPRDLFNPGFQLSFTVVAAILLLAPPIQKRLEHACQPDSFLPSRLYRWHEHLRAKAGVKLASLLAVSIAAWLGSLPLTLGYFHLISWTALPANLIAIPLSFIIMAVAALSLIGGIFSQGIAIIFNNTVWLAAKALLFVVATFAQAPGSFLYVGWPQLRPPLAEITVFDFEDGGGILVEASGSAWMLDSGPARAYDNVLLPYLRNRGYRHLNGLLISHGDALHIGSAEAFLDSFSPGLVMDSALDDRSPVRARLHEKLASSHRPKRILLPSDRTALAENVEMETLFPPPGIHRGVADDQALVTRLEIGSTRVLILPDAGLFTEKWLLKNASHHLPCDILITGTPRSGPPLSDALLKIANPRVAILATSFRGTSESATLFEKSAKALGATLFRLDQTGAVTIRVERDSVKSTAFLNQQTFQFHP